MKFVCALWDIVLSDFIIANLKFYSIKQLEIKSAIVTLKMNDIQDIMYSDVGLVTLHTLGSTVIAHMFFLHLKITLVAS